MFLIHRYIQNEVNKKMEYIRIVLFNNLPVPGVFINQKGKRIFDMVQLNTFI